MKVKALQKRKAADLVIALVFALCILIVAFIYRSPGYESVRDEQPMFLVIDRQPLITMLLLPREGLQLVLAAVAVVTGVFLSLLSLFIGLNAQDRPRVFYLGAVAAAAGVWKLCGLSIVPLLLDHHRAGFPVLDTNQPVRTRHRISARLSQAGSGTLEIVSTSEGSVVTVRIPKA